MSELSGYGFGDADARAYAKAADDGKAVDVADVSKEKADQAQSIMDSVTSDQGSSEEQRRLRVGRRGRVLGEQGEDHQQRCPRDLQRQRNAVKETVALTTGTVGAERRDADTLDYGNDKRRGARGDMTGPADRPA